MSKLFDATVTAYIRLVPEPIRSSALVRKLKRVVPHDLIYTQEYYVEVEEAARAAAPTIASSIVSEFRPGSVIDVGCGTGAVLEALRSQGCEVFGLEYAEGGLEYCRSRNLDVRKFNLEDESLDLQRTFDVAVSTEVAEHLPESCADRYIDLLTKVAPRVVFTAAFPGQGGTDHVNEQPASYWIHKYADRGFAFDESTSMKWRQQWREANIARWYWMNAMIFIRN